MKRIAIFGATGYIGKSLARAFVSDGSYEVTLFARSTDKYAELERALEGIGTYECSTYDRFADKEYDVIVNCVGIGNPSELRRRMSEVFSLTEEFDRMILSYLERNPKSLCVNMSSGAAYGKGAYGGATGEASAMFDVNALRSSDMYGIAKLNSESKHRIASSLNIVDLRVFSFFSEFVDPDSGFLLSDIVRCVMSGDVFDTSGEDIVRDYVGSDDLFSLIRACMERGTLNDVFDVYSRKPVSKFELLKFFNEKYGLKYRIREGAVSGPNPTGHKDAYFSKNERASELSYRPAHTSIEGIEVEMERLMNRVKRENGL